MTLRQLRYFGVLGSGQPGPMTVPIRDRFRALMDEPSPLIEAIDY